MKTQNVLKVVHVLINTMKTYVAEDEVNLCSGGRSNKCCGALKEEDTTNTNSGNDENPKCATKRWYVR